MSNYVSKVRLTKNNKHLVDIFSDNYYLELGNINSSSLQSLLKRKMVRYSDLTYFNIQKKGIGTSSINDDELKEKMPYYYFYNLVMKKQSLQLFITYGILIQRRGYKELFTPIVLIPVNMYISYNIS